jgi:signal transduction histidine kinase
MKLTQPSRLRSIIGACVALIVGLVIHYYEDWCEKYPVLNLVLNDVEFVIMGPGMAVLTYLVLEQFRLKEKRYRERVEQERERRFQFLGRIAASMAHEVRNPLHNIHLLNDELRRQAPENCNELIACIKVDLTRLDQAIELIYELAKPPHKNGEEPIGTVDIVRLAHEVCDEVRNRHGSLVSLIHRVPELSLMVRGRAESLRIVLLNLFRNAVEAAGGGMVTVEYGVTGSEVNVRIENPGTLPREILSDEFDGISHKPGGLGVGVAIAKHLASFCGGRVEFEVTAHKVITRLYLEKSL